MSYYATINGVIEVSSDADPIMLLDLIKDPTYSEAIEVIEEADNHFTLVFGCYGDYKEDEICSFLKEIESYTLSGEIDYYGEDNRFWRHYFDRSKHCWIEQNGFVQYLPRGRTLDFIIAMNKANRSKEQYANDD